MPKIRYQHFRVKEPKVKMRNPRTNRYVQVPYISSSDGIQTQGPSVEQQPPNQNDDAESIIPTTKYREKKERRLQQWSVLHKALLRVDTEKCAPSTVTRCNHCFGEVEGAATIRCLDCGPAAYYCLHHFDQQHKYSPFHSPEIWNTKFFVPFHPDRPALVRPEHVEVGCRNWERAITVVGLRGRLNEVIVKFCSCEEEPVTLLRHGLWAASPERPFMAFETSLMDWLRALVLDCQVSVKGFVDAISTQLHILQQLSVKEVTRLYHALVTDSHNQYMQHHYQLAHLQPLDPTLDDGTDCPACGPGETDSEEGTSALSRQGNGTHDPGETDSEEGTSALSRQGNGAHDPGETDSEEGTSALSRQGNGAHDPGETDSEEGTSALSSLGNGAHDGQAKIYSLDANFGLVRKKSSGAQYAEPFHKGHYFVEQKEVDQFVASYTNTSTKRDVECSNFRAGTNKSKMKTAKLDETAVFGSACRHEFPQLFFSLKHGERLSYPVHLIERLLAQNPEKNLIVMYDIACILDRHLKNKKRKDFDRATFVLPIFHSFGHKMACQMDYGTRNCAAIGLTDGETMERLWSYLRKFATITKQMNPERRSDLLVDALLHYASKLRKNTSRYLLQKKKNLEATERAATSQYARLTAVSPVTVTPAILAEWRREAKEVCNAKERKGSSSAKQSYILALFSLDQQRASLSSSDSVTDETSKKQKIDVLEDKVAKLEKQHAFVRLLPATDEYKEALGSAVQDMRQRLLNTMRSVAAERHYTLSQLAEASGQDIAKKLSGSVKSSNKRLKLLISSYNEWSAVPSLTHLVTCLTFSEVASITSAVYDMGGGDMLLKKKLVDGDVLKKRCQEEDQLLIRDAKNAHSWYVQKHNHCKMLLDQTPSLTRLDVGYQALLCQQLVLYEQQLSHLENLPFVHLNVTQKTMSTEIDQFVPNVTILESDEFEELSVLELQEVLNSLEEGTDDLDDEDEEQDIEQESAAAVAFLQQ